MLNNRIWYAAGLTIFLLVAFFTFKQVMDPVQSEVREVIRTPQTYDGEHIDLLVALGSPAVPTISNLLDEGDEFPLQLIFALERIEDTRGLDGVLRFIASRSPFSSSDDSHITSLAIKSLRSYGDDNVSYQLSSLLDDENVHPRVRLAAAGTISAIASGDELQRARRHILFAYENRSTFHMNPNDGFTEQEIYASIAEVGTDESNKIMEAVLRSGTTEQIAFLAIDSIAVSGVTSEGSSTQVLLSTARDRENYELPVRLYAIEHLLTSGENEHLAVESIVRDMSKEAEEDTWSESIVERINVAKVKADSKK